MFCKICGFEIPAGANVCPRCGSSVKTSEFVYEKGQQEKTSLRKKVSAKGIVGFSLAIGGFSFFSLLPILTIICGVAGIILSAIGKKETDLNALSGRGFATAGMIVSIIGIVMAVLFTFLIYETFGGFGDFYEEIYNIYSETLFEYYEF